MKNIDVLNGKIEEVRKGNNPCSNATFDKTNGIVGSQFTNGYEVEEDRESLKNVCGNKLVSTEISSDEATAAKNNKDGCPNPYNSSKAAATTASTVNRPNDSTSSCTKNGISSGQKDTNNATGVSTTPSQEKIYKSENCKESNKFRMGNMSSTASEKAGNESGQKVEELISSENRSASKVGKEFSTKKVGSNSTQVVMLNGSNDSKNVSDSILKNDKDLTEKTESQLPGKNSPTNEGSNELKKSDSVKIVASSGKELHTSKEIGVPKMQESVQETSFDDESKTNEKISKPDVADSKKEQGEQKVIGEKKIQEDGKKTSPNDDSKKNEKSISKPDVADSNRKRDDQKGMGEKKIQDGKKTLPIDDSKKNEKSISKSDVADSKKDQNGTGKKKIYEEGRKTVPNDDSKKNEKSILKSDVADSKKEREEQKAMGEKKIQELGKKTLPSDDLKKNEKISKPDVADSNKKRDEQKEMREKKIQEVVKQAVPKDDTKKNEKSISKSNMEDSKKEQEEQKAMGEKKIQELGKKTLPSDDSKKNEKISKPNVADSNKKRDEQKGMGEKKIQELGKKTLPNDSKKNEKSISKSDVADSTKEQEQKAMGEKKVQELGKKTLLNDTSKSNENPILKPDKPKETGRKESQKFENKTSPNVSSKATEESTISKTKAVAETLTRNKKSQPNESEVQKSQEPEKNNSCNITSKTTGESSLKSEAKTRTVTEKKDKQNGNDVKNTQQSEKISIDDDSRKSDKSNLKSGVTVTGNHKSKEKEAENTKEFEKKTSSSVEPKLTGKPTVKSDATVSKTELCEPIIDIEITQKSEKKIPSNDDSKKDEKSDLKPGGGDLADSKNIEETSKEIGIKKTQDSGKDSTLSDDLKKDDKSILKPETVIETISATRLDQNKSEDNKIQLSENKTSLNDASKTIEKSILMSDVDKPATRVEQDNTKESEETKTEESVDNILANDKVAASNENGSTLKSDKVEDDINSADNSTSQDDKLNKKLEKTLPNQDKLDKDEEKVASVPETYKESKKIDDSSSKTDEIEKTDIQEKLSDGPEKIEDSVSKKSSIDGEVTSPEETVTENVGLMQVDSIGTVETCEKVEIGAVELAAKEDSESKQDRDIESTVTPEASEGKEALQEIVESSDKSDVQAVSSSTECPKIGQKRPAEFEEDSVKRLKTDDCSSPTVDDDCSKKRVCPSPDDNDAGTELKRKRTESIHGDNNSSDTSKSNVKSDSINSEKSSKLNIKDSNIEPEESPKLDVDNDSEVESSLDLEYKADSPDPISRTSSVSDVNEAKSSILTRLLSSDVGDDSNISISDDSLPSTKVRSLCGSASPNRDDMESESAAPGNEEEESSSVVLLKETLKRMKKSDLEKLVMLKVSESLSYKSEIGDLRTKYHAAKESIDRWRKRCNFFEKIKTELSMTMSKYLREVEACKNSEKGMEFSIPMKFTRSVGLQVSVPIGHQKRHHDVRVHQQKSKPELSEIQQKYIQQQQQVHEQQQLQQKQQQQKEQQNVLKDQESSQTSSTKTAVPKVTTNVRSSTPRRLASSRPTQAAEPNSKVNQVFPVSSTSQKLPLRSGAATSSTAAVTTSAALPTTATASLAQSGSSPVPVAITASKIASPSTSSASLEVIDLTEKDDRSRVCQDTQKNASPPVSFAVVKQFVSPGKSTIAGNPANGQRTYLVPTSAVAGNSRQLLIATTAGINQIPIATAVMTSSGRNNAVTLPANAVIVKNGVLQSAAPNVVVRSNAIVQRPVQSVKPTQSASHPAPLPPCPPAIHENGWRLAPPRPQLVVRKTPSGTGIMLSWTLSLNKSFEDIASYQLYAYQEGTSPPSSSLWKKVGDVKALPLPMACTLTQFVEGHKYHFAVRAVDIHSRVGHFSGPSTITLN